ncbi:uncharacterized protein LTR77_001200 [Saxophila tyrrhenica]|uniref:Cytochrome P450 n=1 Tax=Saxophila tyrrhenica TaxID=1690608 RepID=A0AAV9PK50_9PEZI|nr:hypothetical protein LTR77_001200 [Saxophila tyrrhenica]
MAVLQISLVIAAYIVYKLISSYIADRRFNSFAEKNGCLPPADVSEPFPWGFRRLYRILRVKKTGEDVLDDIIMSDFDEAGGSRTIQFKVFDGSTMFMTADPGVLQAMLATQFNDFGTGKRRYDVFKPLVGKSIFSSDGPFWEHSRALFRPQFARENINDLEATENASSALITALGQTDSNGWTSGDEVLPLVYNFTLDTATDFLFGQSVESQRIAIAARSGSGAYQDHSTREQIEEAKNFTDSFGIMNDYLIMRIRMQSLWWLGDSLNLRRAIRRIQRFVDPIVKRSIDTATSSAKREEKKQSLMNNLATQTQDRTELRNQALAILLAGRDTTAGMLGWALTRLALHPEVFAKLRSTVLQEFQPGDPITFAKLKGCRYLQHFLNEVLRLHPTVPVNQRSAFKDTVLPVGGGRDGQSPMAVRKGTVILFSVYIMHRRKELWGEDALEFRPERWSEQRYPAWQFLPFLGGPRICLGQQFALTEASYLLVRLLQQFDAMEPTNAAEAQKLKKGLGVTMWPGDGTKVRFRKAAST